MAHTLNYETEKHSITKHFPIDGEFTRLSLNLNFSKALHLILKI